MNQPTEELKTPDLYLAAYLRTLNINPVQLVAEGSRTFFLFKKTKELEKAVRAFTNDETLELQIKTFIRAVRDIKYLVYHPGESIL